MKNEINEIKVVVEKTIRVGGTYKMIASEGYLGMPTGIIKVKQIADRTLAGAEAWEFIEVEKQALGNGYDDEVNAFIKQLMEEPWILVENRGEEQWLPLVLVKSQIASY